MQKEEMKKIIEICDFSKWALLVFAALIFVFNYDTPNIQNAIIVIMEAFEYKINFGLVPENPTDFVI
jgi:hypothetical protein